MITPRHALAVAIAVLVTAPATAAHAAIDSTEAIRALATDAAQLVAQEQALVRLTDGHITIPTPDLADAQLQLRAVDADGAAVLAQLDEMGVELTDAIRVAMAPLPRLSGASPDEVRQLTPRPVVYDAAIDDLLRIAATPAAVAPEAEHGSSARSFGLLAVAALSLLALGSAALANTFRRHTDADELAAMAWSDALTGLANRRRLDHDLGALQRLSGPTAVIMLDVDHFKSVNDTHGHQVGDDMLRQVSAMLAEHVRIDDVVYRYGGEEFCIMLPDATADDARAVADRIVRAARAIELPDGTHLTVSVGVADAANGDVATAVDSADRALYLAKQNGRDRAETAIDASLTPA